MLQLKSGKQKSLLHLVKSNYQIVECDFNTWDEDTKKDFFKEIASLFTENELNSFSFQTFLDQLDVVYAYEPDYDIEKIKGPAKKFWDLYKAGKLKNLKFGDN